MDPSTSRVSDKRTFAAKTTACAYGKLRRPRETSLLITARDEQGQRRTEGGDSFVIELQDYKGELEVTVKDRGDGTYRVRCAIPEDAVGDLNLVVSVHGSPIQGSPFQICAIQACEADLPYQQPCADQEPEPYCTPLKWSFLMRARKPEPHRVVFGLTEDWVFTMDIFPGDPIEMELKAGTLTVKNLRSGEEQSSSSPGASRVICHMPPGTQLVLTDQQPPPRGKQQQRVFSV